MTKTELKVGMKVRCRDNWSGIITHNLVFNAVSIVNDELKEAEYLDQFNDDLTCIDDCDCDIVEVYDKDMKLIWSRND